MRSLTDTGLLQRGTIRVVIEDGRNAWAIEVAIPRGGLAQLHRDHDLPFGGPHRVDASRQRDAREESIGMIERAVGRLLREKLAAADPRHGYSVEESCAFKGDER